MSSIILDDKYFIKNNTFYLNNKSIFNINNEIENNDRGGI